MVYKRFDKKFAATHANKSATHKVTGINSENQQIVKLTNELHIPIIRKFRQGKVYSYFKDNIWDADLADIQLISKYNKGMWFLWCFIDVLANIHGLLL